MERIVKSLAAALAAALVALTVAPSAALAADTGSIPMYRLYNQWTWEHFYTADIEERDFLANNGWTYEAIGWFAPQSSDTPVYRLYNPWVKGGDHHYTTSTAERDACVAAGWRDEGIGWYSSDSQTVPVLREYNPYAKTGTHNYTASAREHESLIAAGWRDEGIGWYGVTAPTGFVDTPVVIQEVKITNVYTTIQGGSTCQQTGVVSFGGIQCQVLSEAWFQDGGDIISSMGGTSDVFPAAGTGLQYVIVFAHPNGYKVNSSTTITINGTAYAVDYTYTGYMGDGMSYTQVNTRYRVTTS